LTIFTAVIAAACAAIAGLGWCVYQLLLQIGKLQLRFDALEKRLYSQGILTGDLNGVSDGLPLGSVLHDFELPALTGGTMTLSRFRGRRILLIFFSPSCSFSRSLLPDLAALPAGDSRHPSPVIVSTGDEEENRSLFTQHGVPHPVLLQQGAEVASLYWVNTTPAAYLVDENGMTASILYTGAEALLRAARGSGHATAPTQAEAGRRGFSRSLDQSKITRDGLKSGTPAPDFTLPLVGGGDISLHRYRGQEVLLVFSDPNCEPCRALTPRLEELHGSSRDVQIVMISRGDEEANRRKIAEHGLTFPVALQRHWEISRTYGIFATPVGFWIDADGVLAADVAVGSEAILKLAARAGIRVRQQPMLAAR